MVARSPSAGASPRFVNCRVSFSGSWGPSHIGMSTSATSRFACAAALIAGTSAQTPTAKTRTRARRTFTGGSEYLRYLLKGVNDGDRRDRYHHHNPQASLRSAYRQFGPNPCPGNHPYREQEGCTPVDVSAGLERGAWCGESLGHDIRHDGHSNDG